MLPVALAVLALTSSAQVGDPPPPPVFEEDRIGEDEWIPPPEAEPDEAPRAAPTPPAPAETPRGAPEVKGVDELTALLVHVAAVALISTVLLPINYYATLLSCGLWPCLVWPALSSYAITWSGDLIGRKRAAWLWPFVASTVTGASIGGLVAGGALLLAGLTGAAGGGALSPLLFVPAVFLVGGGVLCGPCASGTAGAIAYYVVAEPKPPGDKARLPGWMEPAGPEPRAVAY